MLCTWMEGGPYSKKLGEVSLVDSDSTRREEHAPVGHSSEWAKFHFNFDFLTTGGARRALGA